MSGASDPGDAPGLGRHVRTELVRFVRALRHEGASVPANAAGTGARALAVVGVEDRDRARTALRASLVSDRDDFDAFDRLFVEFWRRLGAGGDGDHALPDQDKPGRGIAPLGSGAEDGESPEGTDGDDGREGGNGRRAVTESFTVGPTRDGDGDADDEATTALYSSTGSASAVEGRLLPSVVGTGAAFRDLTRALAGLQGHRFGTGTDHADVRRALRASVSTGGTPLSLPRRERKRTAVRALLLVDVSRSVLDVVDRGFLVDFLRLARREWRHARVFLFDEDLREVSEPLDAPTATAAMRALEAAEEAWGGGTRIGGSLESLRRRHPGAVDRRTVVFLVSDGLEMGDVDGLEREVSWLARRGKRLYWLNPLAASEGYEPTARGMAAARPYLDGLFAFAGPADLVDMAGQLRRQGAGGRVGYEFGSRNETDGRTTAGTTET